MIWRFIQLILVVCVVLVAVLVGRTLLLSTSSQSKLVKLPDAPEMSVGTAVAHLSEAIRFKTTMTEKGFPETTGEKPWLDFHNWLATTYPKSHEAMTREVVPGTQTLLYTWTGSDTSLPPILLMAHQDVVPVNQGTEADWKAPPFEGKVIDGYLYGRGAIDDKGSLISWMEVTEALANNNFKPKRTIIFLFGHDEEVGGKGAEAGIKLLKSRGIKPEMALDEGSFIIDKFPLTGKPMALIGISEKSYLTVELTASSKGGHSSIPPRNSAAVKISGAVLALDNNQLTASLLERPISDMINISRPEMPFVQRILFSNLWLFEGLVQQQMAKSAAANALIRTTTAPTMLSGSSKENVLAQRAKAVINFRIHPKDSIETILAHIKKVTSHIPGLEIKVISKGTEEGKRPPVSPLSTKAYQVLAAVGSEAGGNISSAPMLVLGATDGRYATKITDNVYRFVPIVLNSEDIDGFHGTNERISLENMKRKLKAYAQIILAMDEK
ncbi:MAG: M20 family peptidase [Methyloligellaceae bacterium]